MLLIGSILQLALLQQTPAMNPPPSRLASNQDYEIGTDDILKVTVYGHGDLIQTVVVQSDGSFIFPLIGRVKAEGLTPKELEQKIGTLLGQGFIRNPQVTVVVQEYRSKSIFVVGEVARPGTYQLSEGRTIVEILSRAGPMLPTAGAEVVVVRPSRPTTGPVLPAEAAGRKDPSQAADAPPAQVLHVNVRNLQAGDLGHNFALQPNDTIFVPQAARVFVTGQVRTPGAYPILPGTTVRQAISLAGGFTEHASTSRIRVVRVIGGKPKEVKVGIDDALQPGDTVVIKESLF